MKEINNPLNIRFNPRNDWNGQVGEKNGFVVFDSNRNGIRAGFVLLHTYWTKRNCRTLWDILHRFAPPSENNTLRYVDYVRERFLLHYGTNFPYDVPLGRTWSSAFPRICKLIKFMCDYETPDHGIQLETIFSIGRRLNLK